MQESCVLSGSISCWTDRPFPELAAASQSQGTLRGSNPLHSKVPFRAVFARSAMQRDPVIKAVVQTSHGDDDLPLGVSFLQIPDGLRYLNQPVATVNDRCDLSRLNEVVQDNQVLLIRRRNERDHPLAH